MKKLILILINNLDNIKYIFKGVVNIFKLWSLNLIIPISFSLISPILVSNFSDISMCVENIFYYWLINGMTFQIIYFMFCILIFIDNELS